MALICKKYLKSLLFSTTISEFKPILTFSAIYRDYVLVMVNVEYTIRQTLTD